MAKRKNEEPRALDIPADTDQDEPVVDCPCCMGGGKVQGPEGPSICPLCRGHLKIPELLAKIFLNSIAGASPTEECG